MEMLSRFVFSLAACFMLACSTNSIPKLPASHVDRQTAADIVATTDMSVVLLGPKLDQETLDAHNLKSDRLISCSGTWISQTEILTAYHCVIYGSKLMDETDVDMDIAQLGLTSVVGRHLRFAVKSDLDFTQDRRETVTMSRDAIIDRVSVPDDLAIIKTTGYVHKGRYAVVASRPIEQGEPIHAMSHTFGLAYGYTRGYVSFPNRKISLSYAVGQTVVMQVASDMSHGSSGGGVFDSENRLIGVTVAIANELPSVTMVIHHEKVRNLMLQKSGSTIQK